MKYSHTHTHNTSRNNKKVFKDSKEYKTFRPNFPMEGIFGGVLLGVRSTEFIDFYDWLTCKIVRRILVCPVRVFWSEAGSKCVIACEESYYVLQYDPDIVQKFFDEDIETNEQGLLSYASFLCY